MPFSDASSSQLLFFPLLLMGFPFVGIRIPLPKPIAIIALLHLLHHIKSLSMAALSHLSLFNPVEQDFRYVNRPSPSLVPLPIHTFTASIKRSLPVLSYHAFLENYRLKEEDDTCAVCLSGFERNHEIRELSNCSHVFHRGCLDSWVDEGQVTCPLCRSPLLPANGEMKKCGDPWMLERNAYLFGEEYVM